MKKCISVLLSMFLLNLSIFAVSTYSIKDADALKLSSENIITDWDFYWGKFVPPTDTQTKPDLVVQVPSDWNKYKLPDDIKQITKTGKGSGTYRLKLTNLRPNQKYAFPTYRLGYTAFEIFADQTLIFRSGSPNEKWENTIAAQAFDKAVFTADENGSVTLTIFISNDFYRKGGFRGSFTLYEEETYAKYHTRQICSYSIFSGILLMIVVFCILNSIFEKSKANIYLACLVLTIYSRIASYLFPLLIAMFPGISFELMLRIEYISVFFIPGFITLYTNELNKNIFKHIPAWIIALPSFILFILDFTLPIGITNRMVPLMQAYMFTVIGLLSILFAIRIFKDRDIISITAIISFLILAFGGIGDILSIHHVAFLKGTHPITPAFVLFSLTQILFMASMQNKKYLKTLEVNSNLQETNKSWYRFVPEDFLKLINNKEISDFQPGESKVTKAGILSADMRNFTAECEKLAPIQVFDMLNIYFKRITPIIQKYDGVIEKHFGDAIIVIFPDRAEPALKCALEIQEAMIELREEFASRGMPRIRIGIGLHYGNIILGTGESNNNIAAVSLSDDIDTTIITEEMTKRCMKPILATSSIIKAADIETEFTEGGLQFIRQRIPMKLSEIDQTVFSIYNEKIENFL